VIRNIIFDWSGTLVDDLPAVWAATNAALKRGGVPEMNLERFRAEFCLPFPVFYQRVIPQVPLDTVEEWFHDGFRKAQDLVKDLPHSRQFLIFCKSHRIRMFVLSSIHEEYYRIHTKANGFDKFIEKPYLAIRDKQKVIGELLSSNKLKADETLFVGDMQHDMDTAHHGKVHSCAVLTGYNNLNQLRASKPEMVVEHLGELKQILETQQFELKRGEGAPVCTVGALVYNDAGQVLMVKTPKWSDLWGIPGGKIKFGETMSNALRREILEETDMQVDDIHFVLTQDCIHSDEFYRDAHFVLLNYTCRARGAQAIKLNDEAREYQWTDFTTALKLNLNTPTRVLLEQVARQQAVNGSNHH